MLESDPLFSDPASGDFRLLQEPCQPGVYNPCVDAGDNWAANNGYFCCSTRTDGKPDEDLVDLGFHYGNHEIPPLAADKGFLSQEIGGTIYFDISAGILNANRKYILLGGASGTDPGIPLPGGQATLPINWDWFTDFQLPLINASPLFKNFMGNLDWAGNALATQTARTLPPEAIGLVMYYAYCCQQPFDYASNAVMIEVIP